MSPQDLEIAESIARVAEGNPGRGRSGFAGIDEVEALRRVIEAARATLVEAVA